MQPTEHSIELAVLLAGESETEEMLADLQDAADEVQELIPDCVGLSISWSDTGVAFTLTATSEEIAILDALAYLRGDLGLNQSSGDEAPTSPDRVLDERSWQDQAQDAAAPGVKQSLTLALTREGDTVGAVNLYAASDNAFEGHHQQLAALLGASASAVVRNADLSFSSREAPKQAVAELVGHDVVDQATGILMAARHLDAETAQQLIVSAAQRAGLTPEQLAQGIMSIRGVW